MTSAQLRQQIFVSKFCETEDTISIKYKINGKVKHLPIHKDLHEDLMAWVSGPVSQWDCINIVVAHENNVRKRVQHIDMAALQTELKNLN
jgi:hypothetical protein